MSTLRSAVDEFRTEDLDSVDDDVLEADLSELFRAADILHSETLRRIAEVERRGSFARDGHLSVTAWLVGRFRLAWPAANDAVHSAGALRSMPVVRAAFAAGEIGRSAVSALVHAATAHHEAFTEAETLLVDAARSLPVADLRRALDHWRSAVDHHDAERAEEERFERRNLHVSPTLDGMVRIDGDLDPETGGHVMTAVQAYCDAEARHSQASDRRTPAQRRADAFGEICRQWLDRPDRPTVAGERPHVSVMIDLDALRRPVGGPTMLEGGSSVSAETARRLACDASVSRIVTRGRSEPLDVGRRTPIVSPAIRRALIVRDGGCAFPDCDRPPAWTDAHHVRHWAQGGGTATSNLVLLCRPHHRLVHRGSFRVSIVGGAPRFSRADGTALADRAPP
jgi:Domain of unknown function (DUF222)/HNH endonuclease